MEKIENIIFDLGGVLLDIDYNLTRSAFEKLGVTYFDKMYSQASADHLFQKLETGHISEQDFYKELNRCTGLGLAEEDIRLAWNAMLLSFREKSLHFLETIRPSYKIFLLSNTNFIHLDAIKKTFYEKERKHSFREYFDKAFYSCEIGLRKPDAECFDWVLNDLKIPQANTVFIDDSAQNIEAAESAGLQTIHLTAEMCVENLRL
ncbi:MAG: HAD family phosphatase [Ginsengibacter sp.]